MVSNTNVKHKIMIKGSKEGLVFHFDDQSTFQELVEELTDKIQNSHQQILSGPDIYVHLQFGYRYLLDEQKDELLQIIATQANLVVKSISSLVITKEQALKEKLSSEIKVEIRTIRNGQVLKFENDIIVLGDVNPGGLVVSNGNVFILGKLSGIAHAGFGGNQEAIIAASYLEATQLRIAHLVYSASDWSEEEKNEREMMFVCSENGKMLFRKINQLVKFRPDLINQLNSLKSPSTLGLV